MRIAIFTNNYLPNPYGVSGSIESFRKQFEALGHTVYVFAPNSKGYVDKNERVFRYGSIEFKFKNIAFPIAIPYSYKLSRILKKLELDVIHAQHPNLLGWQAQRWAKKKKLPLIFTWHTLYDQYAHFTPWFVPKKIATNWAIRNAVKFANNADFVVTPTNSVLEIVCSWGMQNENVEAILTGIEEEKFADARREKTRGELGIVQDEIALVLVSRLTAEKNVLFLANCVAKILKNNLKVYPVKSANGGARPVKPPVGEATLVSRGKQFNRVKFILAGAGSELEKMKKIFEAAGVEKQLVYQGIVLDDQKKNVYAAGDIFVYASKSETQGMVISEAMYSGLPIVALRAPGIVDLVANQISGLLVEEDEEKFVAAILKLIEDENMRKKLGANAREIALNHYSAKKSAAKMLEVYEKAIARKKI